MKCFLHYELITNVKPIANPMDGCFLMLLTWPSLPSHRVEMAWQNRPHPMLRLRYFVDIANQTMRKTFVFLAMQNIAHNSSEILFHQVLFSSPPLLIKKSKIFKIFKTSSGAVLLSSWSKSPKSVSLCFLLAAHKRNRGLQKWGLITYFKNVDLYRTYRDFRNE